MGAGYARLSRSRDAVRRTPAAAVRRTPVHEVARRLQSTAGSSGMRRMIQRAVVKTTTSDEKRLPLVQPTLTVNQPGDEYEQEADQVADMVMRMASLERIDATPEPMVGHHAASDMALPSGGVPLASSERRFFEPRIGHQFSQVRIHSDRRAGLLARSLGARAFTAGRDIVFGAGEYAPSTTSGRRLLAHELTHVVQQRRGGPTPAGIRAPATLRSPPAIQRACGPAGIGTQTGCNKPSDYGVFRSGTDRTYQFNVNCDTFTGSHKANLIEDGKKALAAGSTVKVHGFASTDGDATFNNNLACARAKAAKKVLTDPVASGGAGLYASDVFIDTHGPTPGPRAERRSVTIEASTPPVSTLKIKSETVSPKPTNRARTKLGVGEQVKCVVDPAATATWSVSGGGSVSPASATTTIFTASKSPSAPTVKAVVGSNSATISFSVIAPGSITSTRQSDPGLPPAGPPNNKIGAYTIFDIIVNPTTVSFFNVRLRENIKKHAWTWPDGTGGGIASQIPRWSVGFGNDTADNIRSGPYPIRRLHDGAKFVDFDYKVKWKEEYENQSGTWVEWVAKEDTLTEYKGANQKARQTHMGAPGKWQGPWQ